MKRRNLLKSAGVSITGQAFVGSAFAEETEGFEKLAEIREEYESASLVEDLINEQKSLLQRLNSDGILKEPRIKIPDLLTSCEYLESDEGARVWGISHPADDQPAAHITIRRQTPVGRLVIALTPSRSSPQPRAILKTTLPERGDESISAVQYLPDSNGDIKREEKDIIPKRPSQIKKADGSKTNTQGDVSPNGMVVYLCRNRGSESCSSYRCYSWEGECKSDTDCILYDCSGNLCCDGCCCCQDQDRCCELCSSDPCPTPPGCRPDSYECCAGGGCTSCCT